MEVLAVTLLVSVCLAGLFFALFCLGGRDSFGRAEQDSLLPLDTPEVTSPPSKKTDSSYPTKNEQHQ